MRKSENRNASATEKGDGVGQVEAEESLESKGASKRELKLANLREEARAELAQVHLAMTEISRQLLIRFEANWARVDRVVAESGEGKGKVPKALLKDLEEIAALAGSLKVKPEKGRQSDLKRIERLLDELNQIVDGW